jgi:hypothetical protein
VTTTTLAPGTISLSDWVARYNAGSDAVAGAYQVITTSYPMTAKSSACVAWQTALRTVAAIPSPPDAELARLVYSYTRSALAAARDCISGDWASYQSDLSASAVAKGALKTRMQALGIAA